ncbi:MAG: hypothetical protein HY038_08160 [Nitrospirae bacterium]|nr:hypothetical protein [Nitrospirota bacterium]
MIRTAALSIVVLFACLSLRATLAAEEMPTASVIPIEDYGLYDQVVTNKFLTSRTQLVVLERMTIPRLLPDQEGPMTTVFFQQQGYFNGQLPPDLVRDFVGVNQRPGRLEGRFRFGPRYRFVSGNDMEDPEVSIGVPVSVERPTVIQNAAVLDRLAFSRVGRTLRNDQALLYVENPRPDGTGTGFLVWFRRQGQEWRIFDTEVVWTVHNGEGGEGPPLAP